MNPQHRLPNEKVGSSWGSRNGRNANAPSCKGELLADHCCVKTTRFEKGSSIGMLIHDVSQIRNFILDQAAGHFGTTRAQWRILAKVSSERPGGISQSDLARSLGVGKAAVGDVVDRLIEKGFVSRCKDPKDRRVRKVSITKKGSYLNGKLLPIEVGCDEALFGRMSAAEVRLLKKVLQKMESNCYGSLREKSAIIFDAVK